MITRRKIIAYQKALDDFRTTSIGSAFYKFKHALIREISMDVEDSFTDKSRASTKQARDKAAEAEKELLTLLGAPAELLGGIK